MQNPKYKANQKNGGVIPAVNDHRVLYVPIGCNKCIECAKQKRRNWQIRLLEDIKENKNGKFITLTFNNEQLKYIIEGKDTNGKQIRPPLKVKGYALDNGIATIAVRRFLERWRKEYKKSLRHWLVTELGHNGTENIHLHGIIWTDNIKEVERIWQYGYVWTGKKQNEQVINYVSEKTINYITKYMTKVDIKHKHYKAIVLTSPGIGSNYTKTLNFKKNQFKDTETKETYTTRTGHKIALPIYWRNKAYNDEEKEKLWIQKLDKQTRYVCGEQVDVSKTDEHYLKLRDHYRKLNKELGYGGNQNNKEEELYEQQLRTLKQEERINNNNKKKKS